MRCWPPTRGVFSLRLFWKRWGRAWGIETASLVVASAAAWLVTTPLSAYAFNVVSPVGLIGNLLVIPLSSLVLLTGVLSLVAGSLSVFLAEIFNHANRVFISILMRMGELDRRNSRRAFVYPVTVGALDGGLVRGADRRSCDLRISSPCRRDRRRRGFRRSYMPRCTRRYCAVDILDVGQGNAALIDVPGSGDVLLDAGPRFSGRDVVRYLRKQGVGHLESLVLTHGDADHIGGAFDILK